MLNAFAVFFQDELGKPRFKVSNKGVSDKDLTSLHLVVWELEDLIMGFDKLLKRPFLLKIVQHLAYTQGGMMANKPVVHPIGKYLPRVAAQDIQPRIIPNKGKTL